MDRDVEGNTVFA